MDRECTIIRMRADHVVLVAIHQSDDGKAQNCPLVWNSFWASRFFASSKQEMFYYSVSMCSWWMQPSKHKIWETSNYYLLDHLLCWVALTQYMFHLYEWNLLWISFFQDCWILAFPRWLDFLTVLALCRRQRSLGDAMDGLWTIELVVQLPRCSLCFSFTWNPSRLEYVHLFVQFPIQARYFMSMRCMISWSVSR
jgi:hypothetical protein